MSDSEVAPEIDQNAFEDEVDALFMKTQLTILDNESYDMYIPLSVQMENAQWNRLVPSNSEYTNQDEATDSNEPVSFPLSSFFSRFSSLFICR